jgi:hypothetical protein
MSEIIDMHHAGQVVVMTDDPLKTATYTVIGGVILFLLSEAIRGYTIKPTIKMRELRGTIIDRVIFYQAQLFGGISDMDTQRAISTELRSLATQYRAAMTGIYGYWFVRVLRLVPSKRSVDAISRNLVGLSNNVPPEPARKVPLDPYIDRNTKFIRALGKAIGFDFGIGE